MNVQSLEETIENQQTVLRILQEEYESDKDGMTSEEIADFTYAIFHNESTIHWLKVLHGQLLSGAIRLNYGGAGGN